MGGSALHVECSNQPEAAAGHVPAAAAEEVRGNGGGGVAGNTAGGSVCGEGGQGWEQSLCLPDCAMF